ncbi:2-C-methyl-D-erythritol 4-phosphate cytidylyltransferase [Candidatus Omnitrophota bacterium]
MKKSRTRTVAIIPSAGCGKRMRSKVDKPFVRLNKKELIYYTLRALEGSSFIDDIIIVSTKNNIPRFKRLVIREGFSKVSYIVVGGDRRAESVSNGLKFVNSGIDYILVHDAARPLLTKDIIKRTLDGAKRSGGAICAVLTKPTIKESYPNKSIIRRTLNRRVLWEAHTPQVFKRDILLKAYARAGKRAGSFTDEASLVEAYGKKVALVEGSYSNIKVTTQEDLVVAGALLGSSKIKNKKSKLKLKIKK